MAIRKRSGRYLTAAASFCVSIGLFSEDIHDELDNDNGANQAAGLKEAIEEYVDYPVEVVPVMWPSTVTNTIVIFRADKSGETLALWLEEAADQYDSITLVGHSLGARVALGALNDLETVTVDSVALIGAGINPDTICTTYREGIENHAAAVYNCYSIYDNIFRQTYAYREFTPGTGCVGADCTGGWFFSEDPPENYTDISISDRVLQHFNYFKPSSMTFLGDNCIGEVVYRQF